MVGATKLKPLICYITLSSRRSKATVLVECGALGICSSEKLDSLQIPASKMRAFLARRDRDGRASRRLRQAREWVDGHTSTKMVYWEVRCQKVLPVGYTKKKYDKSSIIVLPIHMYNRYFCGSRQ